MKINNKNLIKFSATIVIVMVMVIFVSSPALATTATGVVTGLVTDVFGFIAGIFIGLFSWFLAMSIGILVSIAQYNDFLNAAPVNQGWTVVRDIANMFFVIGLLLIAFQTVIKGSQGTSYQWSKNLLNLVLMAILINFSKFICGLAIDVSQVAMMTFVNAFKGIGAGNLQSMLGLQALQDVYKGEGGVDQTATSNMTVIAGYIGIILMLIISIITIMAFILILCWRVVILWILVVLSPAAFALQALDIAKAKSYAKEWVSQFSRYLVVGPLMAFFLWLSFAAFKTTSSATSTMFNKTDNEAMTAAQGVMQPAALQPDNIGGLIVVIAFLVGGLAATKKLGVAGGALGAGLVDKGRSAVTSNAKKLAAMPYKAAGVVAGSTISAAGKRMELAGGKVGALARGTRLIATKEGRKTLAERTEARIMSGVGGLPGAKVAQREKEIKRQEDLLKLAGVEDDPQKMAAMQEKYEEKGDSMGYLALMNLKAKKGKIKPEDFDKAVEIGAFNHYGDVKKTQVKDKDGNPVLDEKGNPKMKLDVDGMKDNEKGRNALVNIEKLTKGWEKSFQEENGYVVPFSPFMFDKESKKFEIVAGGSKGDRTKAKETRNSVGKDSKDSLETAINNDDFGDVTKNSVFVTLGMMQGVADNGKLGMTNLKAQEKGKELADEQVMLLTGDTKWGGEVEKMIRTKIEGQKETKEATANMTVDQRKEWVNKKVATKMDEVREARTYLEGNDEDLAALKEKDPAEYAIKKKEREQEYMQYLENAQRLSIDASATHEAGTNRVISPGKADVRISNKIQAQRQRNLGLAEGDSGRATLMEVDTGAQEVFEKYKDADAGLLEKKMTEKVGAVTKETDPGKITKIVKEVMARKSIYKQQKEYRGNFGDSLSARIRSISNKVKQGDGASSDDIDDFIDDFKAAIESTQSKAAASGMPQEYFNTAEMDKLITDLEADLIAAKGSKNASKQRAIVEKIQQAVAAKELYTGKVINLRGGKKKGDDEDDGDEDDTTPPGGSTPPPSGGSPPPSSAPPKPIIEVVGGSYSERPE